MKGFKAYKMDRKTKAEELFKSGYNCSQSVIGAFCDDLGLDFDTAMKISEGFGGGIGRMRLTCGAVSGMVMAVGMILSSGADEGDTRGEVYGTVKSLCDEFREMYGSIVCADLLGLNNDTYSPTPEGRTQEFYKKRPCVECVKDCVGLVEKKFFD